ncbi:hypothetical protein BKA00_000953 [Actinomadura coerulea]|uniref:Uncharacterized protein n=1 Tax=Actinomadura coerulea TaxID=46159 RepID=A0A7X0KXD8_9ACTN|nr:hypothetical protein [Actinomadura coerulea]MBB6394039.1 hypothetical protein [Actinomadura coerulea]GGQ19868.1 hypothetical protein GCM10010187_40080 [Actinomadura coerulea]
MSQTVGIAQFVRESSDLGECQGGTDLIGRDEVQAFLGSITDVDAAMAKLAASLEAGDVFRAGMMAFVCGVLVERGGSVAVPVDAVMQVTERYLHLAKEFTARGGAGAQDELFRESPDLVRAHHVLPFVLLAAMTMLSRDEGARRRLRARPHVAPLVDELEDHYETLYYIREVLALLDGREILLLDPRGRRGFVLGLTGVQDRMYHFFALAQDALERHAGPGYLGAEPADPAVVRYARNRGLTPQEHQRAAELIDHQRIGFHYPGADAKPALFFPGSAPFEAVPVFDGLPTLFLDEKSISAQWSPANMYPVLHEALESRVSLRELAPGDVEARLAAFAG